MISTAHPDLDAYLDGAMTDAERHAIEAHLASCDACAAELALAKRISEEMPALRGQCPDDVFDAAVARIARLERDRAPIRASRLRWAAVAAAVAVVGVAGLQLLQGLSSDRYSPEEVAEARQQIELAFGLVGKATGEASTYIRFEVFPDQLTEPRDRRVDIE